MPPLIRSLYSGPWSARGDSCDKYHRIPRDKTERIYRQDEGVFAPPSRPSTLPVGPRALEEDKILHDFQNQWGMTVLVISWGIISLEAAVNEVCAIAAQVTPETAHCV